MDTEVGDGAGALGSCGIVGDHLLFTLFSGMMLFEIKISEVETYALLLP